MAKHRGKRVFRLARRVKGKARRALGRGKRFMVAA